MKRKLIVFLSGILFWMLSDLAMAAEFRVTTVEGLRDALTTAANNGQDDRILILPGTCQVAATLVYVPADSHALTLGGEEDTILDGGDGITEGLGQNQLLGHPQPRKTIRRTGLIALAGIGKELT